MKTTPGHRDSWIKVCFSWAIVKPITVAAAACGPFALAKVILTQDQDPATIVAAAFLVGVGLYLVTASLVTFAKAFSEQGLN